MFCYTFDCVITMTDCNLAVHDLVCSPTRNNPIRDDETAGRHGRGEKDEQEPGLHRHNGHEEGSSADLEDVLKQAFDFGQVSGQNHQGLVDLMRETKRKG